MEPLKPPEFARTVPSVEIVPGYWVAFVVGFAVMAAIEIAGL